MVGVAVVLVPCPCASALPPLAFCKILVNERLFCLSSTQPGVSLSFLAFFLVWLMRFSFLLLAAGFLLLKLHGGVLVANDWVQVVS